MPPDRDHHRFGHAGFGLDPRELGSVGEIGGAPAADACGIDVAGLYGANIGIGALGLPPGWARSSSITRGFIVSVGKTEAIVARLTPAASASARSVPG